MSAAKNLVPIWERLESKEWSLVNMPGIHWHCVARVCVVYILQVQESPASPSPFSPCGPLKPCSLWGRFRVSPPGAKCATCQDCDGGTLVRTMYYNVLRTTDGGNPRAASHFSQLITTILAPGYLSVAFPQLLFLLLFFYSS